MTWNWGNPLIKSCHSSNQISNIRTPRILPRNRSIVTPATTLPFETISLSQIPRKPGDVSSVVTARRAISHGIVLPPATPTASHVTYTESNHPAPVRASLARDIVTHGTVLPAVSTVPPVDVANISAHYVAPVHTPPNCATQLHDLLVVKTPFIPDTWEKMLNDISPSNLFSDVPISLRFSFNMSVHIPPTQTYTPPNHNSALLFPDHVMSHIQNELSLGRYSGPFLVLS